MVNPDLINGIFELGGAFFWLLNIVQLYRDRQLKGARLSPFVYFGIWSVWNVAYFGYLEQWWSFVTAFLLSVCNITWVVVAWKISRGTNR